MKFNINTGELTIPPLLHLYRGMKRKDMLSQELSWEVWMEIQCQPTSYRALLPMPDRRSGKKIIIVVFFDLNDGPLTEWDMQPLDGQLDGPQKRPEGRYTKLARAWFREIFGIDLPKGGDWGDIDAAHDVRNQTTSIICNYREGFSTEEKWQEYRRNMSLMQNSEESSV